MSNIPDITLRIREIINIMFSGNELAFSKAIDISQPRINRLFKPDPRNNNYPHPSLEMVEKITNKFINISSEWLLTGNGSMLKEEGLESNQGGIPLVSTEAIAGFGSSSFNILDADVIKYYSVPEFQKVDFMITIRGASMLPRYQAGDVVACRILDNPNYIQWNKSYIVATKDQGIICKKLMPSKMTDHYLAVSENEDYPPFDIPFNDIDGLAIVVGVVRLE